MYLTFFKCFQRYSSFLFSSVLKMLLSFWHFNFKYILPWESNFPFFARKSVVLPYHPQASVRCSCASYIYHSHVRRAKASHRWFCTAIALVWCREDDSKNSYVLVQKRIPELLFLSKQTCFFESAPPLSIWRRASGFRRSSLPLLRHRCRSWRLKSVSRLPDYPTLKNDSHEAWKSSVTRKKYIERPHTAVFRRQRLGTTPSTQIFKQDDRFGAKRRRLLLWSGTRTPY